MNPSALEISIPTSNPYHYSFFINSPFLWNNIQLPTNLLQITNCILSVLFFDAFLFNLYYLTQCFCTCLCRILYKLLFVCVVDLGSTFAGPAFVQPLSFDKLIIMSHSKCSQWNMLHVNCKICSWIPFTCVVPIYQTQYF